MQSQRASLGSSFALLYKGGSTWQTHGMWPCLGSAQHCLGLGPDSYSQCVAQVAIYHPGWPLGRHRCLEQCTVERCWANRLA